MASYTGHGHYIPGMPVKIPPKQVKHCGGLVLGICPDCARDAFRAYDGAYMLFSNPAGDFSQKAKSLMPDSTLEGQQPIKATVLNKAVSALHDLGHDFQSAENIIIHLLKSGIILKDASEVSSDVAKVDKVVDEAAPVLEAAEPTLAPEVESVQHVADTASADTTKADADAEEFINEVTTRERTTKVN